MTKPKRDHPGHEKRTSMFLIKSAKIYAKFLVAVVALVVLAVVSAIVLGYRPASLMFEVIFSVTLIVLYSNIARAEHRQTILQEDVVEIQDNQTSLLASQQRPRIVLCGRWITDGEKMILCLSNVGGGSALNLRVQSKLNHEERSYHGWCQYMQLNRQSSVPAEVSGDDLVSLDSPQNYLYPKETEVKFEVPISTERENLSDNSVWVESATRSIACLAERGIGRLMIEAELVYEDNQGTEYTEQILYYSIPTTTREGKQASLSEAVEAGQPQKEIDSMNKATEELLLEEELKTATSVEQKKGK